MGWLKQQLLAYNGTNVSQIVLMIHQPFRCREGVPDCTFCAGSTSHVQAIIEPAVLVVILGYFCFSSDDKAQLRLVFEEVFEDRVDVLWGMLAGHQHR